MMEMSNLKASRSKGRMMLEFPTLLHEYSYYGSFNDIREMFLSSPDTVSSIRVTDERGMTALHFAIFGGKKNRLEVCEFLIQKDSDFHQSNPEKGLLVNEKDSLGKTGLHLAAATSGLEMISLLLNNGANPNLKDSQGSSPFDTCVVGIFNSDKAVSCAKILLTWSPRFPEELDKSGLAVHNAAKSRASKILNFLINEGFDYLRTDSNGQTPLMHATLSGSLECVKILLEIYSYEDINAKCDKGLTALMMAAKESNLDILKALLEDSDVFLNDNVGRNVMHHAVETSGWQNKLACVQVLLESITALVNQEGELIDFFAKRDEKGETSLDIAVRRRSNRITECLLTAFQYPETMLTTTVLDKIYKFMPKVMLTLMDKSVTFEAENIWDDIKEKIDVDFGPIVGYENPLEDTEQPRQETQFVYRILSSPINVQRKMFLHPVIQVFIRLKWKKFQAITMSLFVLQLVWLLAYTGLIITVYDINCRLDNGTWDGLDYRGNTTTIISDCGSEADFAQILAGILYLLSGVILAKELFILMCFHHSLYSKLSRTLQILIHIVAITASIPAWKSSKDLFSWLYNLAVIGIFMAWVLFLREVGRWPRLGSYVAMFRRVLWKFLELFSVVIVLVIGFSVSMRLLYPQNPQYSNTFDSLTKLLAMMGGDLSYDDVNFYPNQEESLAHEMKIILGKIVYGLFVIVMVIVIIAVITAVAVNDVKILTEEAEAIKLASQLKQIYGLESCLVWLLKRKINCFMNRLTVTITPLVPYSVFETKQNVEIREFPEDLKDKIKDIWIPKP